MIRFRCLRSFYGVAASLSLLAAILAYGALIQAASLQGREFFGPLKVNVGETLQIVLANVSSAKSSSVAVRIFDPAGTVVESIGYQKDTPLPAELAPNASVAVDIVCEAVPACNYTVIAELFSESGGAHAPLLSAQVINRDGTAGIWGTGGVASNAIWGTGGVARKGIWGTGGVARTGIWGTGGVAWQDTVGAFPAVRVASAEKYRLVAQNPYDDPITIKMSGIYLGGVAEKSTGEIVLLKGEVATLELPGENSDVVGLVELINTAASNAGPLTTMQVIRSDGTAGIWGTGGVAYEADDRP